MTEALDAGRCLWTKLGDRELLDQCEIDTYRASGPGGQKRNKTSSAVRLRHRPSGVRVIAEESRSQPENKARALKRLRQRFFLQLREPFPSAVSERLLPEISTMRLKLSRKDERFWPAAGVVLDALEKCQGRVAETAEALGVSTSNVIDFLGMEPSLWGQANETRKRFGLKLLKTT